MRKSTKQIKAELLEAYTTINELRKENARLKAENETLTALKRCDNVVLCQNCRHGIKQVSPITFRTGEQQSGHVACDLCIDNVCGNFEDLRNQQRNDKC